MVKKFFVILKDILRNIHKNIYTFQLYFSFKKINNFQENVAGNVLVDAIWENNMHWLKTHLVLKGIYKTYGSNFFALTKLKKNFLTKLILSTFKFKNKIELSEKKVNLYNNISKKLLKNINTVEDLFKLKLKFNFPVFLFHDSHLKKHKIPTIDFSNKKDLIKDLSLQLCLLDQLAMFFKKKKFNALVISHIHGMYYSTIVWICLMNKIKVFKYGQHNKNLSISILKNSKDHTNMLTDWLTKKDILKLKKSKIEKIYSNGKSYANSLIGKKINNMKLTGSYNYDDKNIKSLRDLNNYLGFEKNQKLIIIYSHCYPDFPNIYGKSWYYDYYIWLRKILEIANNFSNYNFLIKPHPAEKNYNCSTKSLFSSELHLNNIKILEKNSPDKKILLLSTLGITAVGSTFFEHISFGKKAITSNLHHSTDLFPKLTYSSFKELKKMLKNIDNIQITKLQKRNANIILSAFYSNSKKNLELPLAWNDYEASKLIPKFINNQSAKFEKEYNLIERFANSRFNKYRVYQNIEM